MEQVLTNSINVSFYGEFNPAHRYVASSNINTVTNVPSYRNPSWEVLRYLTDSRWTVFDVLPTFFSDPNPWVCLGALSFVNRRLCANHITLQPRLRSIFTVLIESIPSMLTTLKEMKKRTVKLRTS